MKLERMSKNIIDIMTELIKNEGLARLLVNYESNPFLKPVKNKTNLMNPNSKESRILPFPFDAEADATTTDSVLVRVYYNNGEFNENEVIAESQIHIDIICARSLWLINDGERSLIRPYEIMGRVIDMVGQRSINSTIKLNFEGYSHLYINPKYDCLRLYANYMSVET